MKRLFISTRTRYMLRNETREATKDNLSVYKITARFFRRECEQMNERFKKVLVKKREVNMNKIFEKKSVY